MITLLHDFPAVLHGSRRMYGGDQSLSQDHTVREVGCGVVACLNVLVYLCRFQPSRFSGLKELAGLDPIPQERFESVISCLTRRYFPLIPKHGINGLTLALGMNRLFRRGGMPYRAHWGVSGGRFWETMERMLRRDIPVILAIGPNFPLFWQKKPLPFYERKSDGRYLRIAQACAHYVTVTGMDEAWLRISSWGREFYLSRREYEDYVKTHSLRLVSNILVIEQIG